MTVEMGIRSEVLDALREILGICPDEPRDEDGKPIGDFGLTSPDGLDFVCELSRRLGRTVPDNINPFVDDARRRARTVRQIIDWVSEQAPGWAEVSHG